MNCIRVIACVVVSSAFILAQAGGGQSDTSGLNAAIKYLRADASLRQTCSVPQEGWSKAEEAVRRPLSNEDDQRVACAAEALIEFEHGASIPKCDWQVSVDDGPFASTAHRGAIRELVATAALRARLRFRDGDRHGAITDLIAGLTAARHLSLDGSIASVLFGFRIEDEISEVLSQGLGQMSAIELHELRTGLSNLPKSSSTREAFESEKLTRNDLRDRAGRAHSADELTAMFAALPALKDDPQIANQIVDACGGSVAGVLSCFEGQSAFYRRWASRFDLPSDQFEKEFTADFGASSSHNAVIAFFTPSLPRLRWAEAYSETRRALVLAAVAVKQQGVKSLAQFPDPYDGRTFKYAQVADGFQLQSSLQQDGRPLSISVR
jgi:hypothetical protein